MRSRIATHTSLGTATCIGNSNAILRMTTVLVYLLSTPVKLMPNDKGKRRRREERSDEDDVRLTRLLGVTAAT